MTPTLPDVLVLGGGGVLGEAWLAGVLAGIQDASGLDLRRCEYFVGTSAGAIVAARLAGGEALAAPELAGELAAVEELAAAADVLTAAIELTAADALAAADELTAADALAAANELTATDELAAANELTAADELAAASGRSSLASAALAAARQAGSWAGAAATPLVPVALDLAAPGGALLRAAVLRGLGTPARTLDALGTELERVEARFDGRLRIVAVQRASGRRVVFGAPRAPHASVAQAVLASCSVPWLFAPVRIGAREYVDGGLWSPTNLDVAPAGRQTHVLCLNPTGGLTGARDLFWLVRGASRSITAVEALALRRRGAVVRILAPDAPVAAAIGPDLMDSGPRARVLALSYRQGLRVATAATGS